MRWLMLEPYAWEPQSSEAGTPSNVWRRRSQGLRGSFEFYGALPENPARKAGAEGAYGRSVISSRRRLQVADGYGFQPPLP